MILSDYDIKQRLEDDLTIRPITDPEVQFQPASVDLCLGSDFRIPTESHTPVNPQKETPDFYRKTDVEKFILSPGGFTLATTVEEVEIPDDIMGKVEGRSSLGRMGVTIHQTAGIIDPGFEGEITLELSNVGKTPVTLHPGMRIAQLVLHELRTPSERPYGEQRHSKYQNQSGAQESRISDDVEFE